MIKCIAECNKCIHNKMCKYKGNAECDAKKLKNTLYSNNPNMDYDWDMLCESRHVDITFSCPDFEKREKEIE